MSPKFALAAILLLSVPTAAQEIEVPEFAGPMVGHVSDREAIIWVWTPKGATLHVRVRDLDADLGRVRVQTNVASPMIGGGGPQHVDVRIVPGHAFEYSVFIDDEVDPRASGSFIAPPATGTPSRFTMATSSCMHIDDEDRSSWTRLLNEKPAFHMLLGDNHYADTTDHDTIVKHHLRYRGVPEFAEVLRNVPTYAMYDDHDYGPNDSDGTEPGKADSLHAFNAVFANPGAGTQDTPGAFYRFSWGDVDFFVVDGRYHRSPNNAPNDEQKRMLGDEQFDWLIDGLTRSTATFRIIASGSTLMQSTADGWRLYDFARERLLRTIMEKRIAGVMYLSGDVHFCKIDEHAPIVDGGYPLYEVISSGITRGNDLGFATLTFDTTLDDPTVQVRILHGDGTIPVDRTIRRSELEVRDPGFTATDAYVVHDVRGWTVRVNPALIDAPDELARRTLELLGDHLYRITRVVPEPALTQLRDVPIWAEVEMPSTACMCYHVSKDWLTPNGYNPEKEGSVEIGNAEAFLEWTHAQPWMVLHELAHAYHFRVLGEDHAEIKAAWKRAVDSGAFESVLHISGKERKHYALTNNKEWFAEATEAYFGTNDFYPFVRSEFERADPEGVAVIRRAWGSE